LNYSVFSLQVYTSVGIVVTICVIKIVWSKNVSLFQWEIKAIN